MDSNSTYVRPGNGHVQEDFRQRAGALLLGRVNEVCADTVAIFPFSGDEPLDRQYCSRLGLLLAKLLGGAVRDGRVDARDGSVGDLYRITNERFLSVERLFTFAYL